MPSNVEDNLLLQHPVQVSIVVIMKVGQRVCSQLCPLGLYLGKLYFEGYDSKVCKAEYSNAYINIFQ